MIEKMTEAQIAECRKAFEEWSKSVGYELEPGKNFIFNAYEAWQAAWNRRTPAETVSRANIEQAAISAGSDWSKVIDAIYALQLPAPQPVAVGDRLYTRKDVEDIMTRWQDSGNRLEAVMDKYDKSSPTVPAPVSVPGVKDLDVRALEDWDCDFDELMVRFSDVHHLLTRQPDMGSVVSALDNLAMRINLGRCDDSEIVETITQALAAIKAGSSAY